MGDCVKLVKLGRRWKSDPEKDTCEQCTALNGKEFYNDPQGDQQSITDMPLRPLHPNCRCTTEVIFECQERYPQEEKGSETPPCGKPNITNPKLPENYLKDKAYALGHLWRKGHIALGPVDGLYGGKEFSAGMDWDEMMKNAVDEEGAKCKENDSMCKYKYFKKQIGLNPPVHDADQAYMEHDDGYAQKELGLANAPEFIESDERLLARLEVLRQGFEGWSDPPPLTDREYTMRYVNSAYSTFKMRINEYYNSFYLPHQRRD